jgi:hypothetical protein
MKSNQIAYPKWTSWAGPVALATATAVGLGFSITQDASLPLRLTVGLVALLAAISAVWSYRVRAARRHFAALDAYADRELDRAQLERRTFPSKKSRAFSRGAI